MTTVRAPRAWVGELARRVRRYFLLKLVGTTVWTWLFFIGYFHLLRHPAFSVAVVPATALDALIPFQPQALVAYVSLWFYVGIAPGLQGRFTELLAYGVWVGALLLAGLGLFYWWPTRVPSGVYDPGGFPGFDVLQGIDAAGNACPSMHVAIAIFTAIWIEFLFRRIGLPTWARVVNAAWFASIVWSTLALKQHVVIDVVAGALLGGVFAALSLRFRPHRGDASPADMMNQPIR